MIMRYLKNTQTPAVNADGTLRMAARLRETTTEEGEISYSLSIYKASPATMEQIKPVVALIGTTFPTFSQAKLSVLAQAVYDNMFTVERLKDAVAHVINTFTYREPQVADIVSYDKCLKLYTYSEACRLVQRGAADFDNNGGDLKVYSRQPVVLWYRVSDAVKCGLLKSER